MWGFTPKCYPYPHLLQWRSSLDTDTCSRNMHKTLWIHLPQCFWIFRVLFHLSFSKQVVCQWSIGIHRCGVRSKIRLETKTAIFWSLAQLLMFNIQNPPRNLFPCTCVLLQTSIEHLHLVLCSFLTVPALHLDFPSFVSFSTRFLVSGPAVA